MAFKSRENKTLIVTMHDKTLPWILNQEPEELVFISSQTRIINYKIIKRLVHFVYMSMETTIWTSGTKTFNTNPTLNVFQLIELNMFPGELRFILFSYLVIFKFSIFQYKICTITLEYCFTL